MRLLLAIFLSVSFSAAFASDTQQADKAETYFNEAGYRSDHYRSDTPDTLEGARILTIEQTRAEIDTATAVVLDVLSAGEIEPDPFDGSWAIDEPHQNIPGSVWLPNVGRGYLDETMTAYFEQQLDTLAKGNVDTHLIFYCVEGCWMAWNAARRALSLGYSNVSWFRRGMTAWEEAGYPTTLADPVAVPVD